MRNIKQSVSVDWMHREATRARIRVLVKKILRKCGHPPDLQDSAVQTALQQAEVLLALSSNVGFTKAYIKIVGNIKL